MSFVWSKFFWLVFNPGALLVLGASGGALALILPWPRLRGFGRGLLVATAVAMSGIAILPLPAWILAPLEDRFPFPDPLPARVEGIVVLGGGIDLRRSVERGRAQLNEHGERMTALAALARRYPDARLIFAGGSGLYDLQEHRESDFAAVIFSDLGIAGDRLRFERNSRNTRENALFAKTLASPRPGETWLLVTSAFHMPRAVGAFRRVQWAVTPYPVDYLTSGLSGVGLGFNFTGGLRLVSLGLHEWIGLLAYRLSGWSDSLFPGVRDANPTPSAPRAGVNNSLGGVCQGAGGRRRGELVICGTG